MQKLAKLHPQADPPDVDVSDTMPVQITAEILFKALQRLPRGLSVGASAWIYKHFKGTCACAGMFNPTLYFMNHIVAGNLPDIPRTLSWRLVIP